MCSLGVTKLILKCNSDQSESLTNRTLRPKLHRLRYNILYTAWTDSGRAQTECILNSFMY
jgi:hypothetical protein